MVRVLQQTTLAAQQGGKASSPSYNVTGGMRDDVKPVFLSFLCELVGTRRCIINKGVALKGGSELLGKFNKRGVVNSR